jgi:hypothetical protein
VHLSDPEPPIAHDAPTAWTIGLRAVTVGVVTLAAVMLLLRLSHPRADVHMRWALSQGSALAALLWVGVPGVAALPLDPRRRPSVLAWMGILLAASAAFWLLGRLVVGI